MVSYRSHGLYYANIKELKEEIEWIKKHEEEIANSSIVDETSGFAVLYIVTILIMYLSYSSSII
jgi:hypothetical protein